LFVTHKTKDIVFFEWQKIT